MSPNLIIRACYLLLTPTEKMINEGFHEIINNNNVYRRKSFIGYKTMYVTKKTNLFYSQELTIKAYVVQLN